MLKSILAARSDSIRHARRVLAEEPVYLDTETTGLGGDAEIVEIAVVDHRGKPLVDTLIRPRGPIPPDATAVHGISDTDVAGAPAFTEVLPHLLDVLSNKHVAIYNAEHDLRLLRQSQPASAWVDFGRIAAATTCVMETYARFYGDFHEYHRTFTWQSLDNAAVQCGLSWESQAHRAMSDAMMARKVLQYMAARKEADG